MHDAADDEHSLLLQAWNDEPAPLHDDLFLNSWLPAILPADMADACQGSPASYVRELYPHIYAYGPRYELFVATLPKLGELIVADLTTPKKPLLTILVELELEFSEKYNEDLYYDLVKDNPEYVYRNLSSNTTDLELIPGWETLENIPGFKDWALGYPAGSNPINATILLSIYKDFYLSLDVFENLIGYEMMAAKFITLLDTYGLR